MTKLSIIFSTFFTAILFPFSVSAENVTHLTQLLNTKQCENCDLTQVGLVMTNLTGANLRGANLMGANLSRANLTGADLSNANLSGASFHGANLSGANLSGAVLNNSDFRNAYVQGIILNGTDISSAHIQGVVGIPANAGNAEQFYLWGVSEDKKGNYPMAVKYYSQAIEMNPDFAQAYLGRAIIKSRYGQTNPAIKDGEKAEELFKAQDNSDGYVLSNRFIQLVKARTESEANDGNEGSPAFVQIVNSVAPLLFKLLLP
ncbi:pentapeptide repeat family protein [Geminocystis sp. NIES-3708]|uniref:pentapeptide repeat-containing protein n=1 Tax=Geminocystis sp. NIES-3708 TaxID=1615909 RepID=UPI0005FCA9D9|nr:pentapeptide repeat-containing protein [Geminocystis sp. NIES-3708]BAQ60849.1 pentapeptide repeat family protein [Geminocystis sp. NIES-3708]